MGEVFPDSLGSSYFVDSIRQLVGNRDGLLLRRYYFTVWQFFQEIIPFKEKKIRKTNEVVKEII